MGGPTIGATVTRTDLSGMKTYAAVRKAGGECRTCVDVCSCVLMCARSMRPATHVVPPFPFPSPCLMPPPSPLGFGLSLNWCLQAHPPSLASSHAAKGWVKHSGSVINYLRAYSDPSLVNGTYLSPQIHHVVLPRLDPNTFYYYQVRTVCVSFEGRP